MDRHRRPHAGGGGIRGLNGVRSSVIGLFRMLFMAISAAAAPLIHNREHNDRDDPDSDGTPVWILLTVSMVLVIAGGIFAGLTIALMGQDSVYLQVLSKDHTEPQHKNARRVYDLLKKGKHWVLVTLLLSNVIVNETLPVVLDRALGGGFAAIFGSTVLIVIFGEVVPQSICVRYGLQIGGIMSKPVLVMMWLMSPVAWPTAKLLDWLLGEDHGTVYRKSGLKTLVTLHRSMGEMSERLNQDEVTIISAVLDLKEKPVRNVMTPMDDVFTMSEDTVLDEKMMDLILSAGYSRIPIHEPGRPTNFIGMLLVKILITYDPEDAQKVRDFPLATLPETRPETSCLDIVNFFQEGKSHMVLVSEYPGEDHGAIGVVTLEDVIEELIGEEIIDESDVYIDVHKAIRRLHPAPNARTHRRQSAVSDTGKLHPESANTTDEHPNGGESAKPDPATLSASPKTMFMMRRDSAGLGGQMVRSTVPVRAGIDQMREHLRHLGPSNPARDPKGTKSTTVKIKPGVVVAASPSMQSSTQVPTLAQVQARPSSQPTASTEHIPQEEGDETTSLLRPPLTVKDGAQALRQSYGSVVAPVSPENSAQAKPDNNAENLIDLEQTEDASTQTTTKAGNPHQSGEPTSPQASRPKSTGGSSKSDESDPPRRVSRHSVRSGSITENIVESRGIRKVVLETASSDDDGAVSPAPKSPLRLTQSVSDVEEDREDEDNGEGGSAQGGSSSAAVGQENQQTGGGGKKNKNRRRKRKPGGKS